MAYYTRKHWTSTANAAVSVKRQQVHATLHYPGFGSKSIRTGGWSLQRCFQQLRVWRNMHVGSGAYREVAYNLYALPTGDVAEGRGNRQNGANGKSSANRAGMSVQVLIGDDEPLTMKHLAAIFEAFALLERWHPGITKRQYGHSHWVSTSCPGPHVRGGIPYRPGTVPKDGGGGGLTGNAPGLSDGLADVDDSQRWLTQLGYAPGPVDGKFGEKTRTATKAFQTEFGITPADGRPGPATRSLLEDAVSQLSKIAKQVNEIHNLAVERKSLDTRLSHVEARIKAELPDKKQLDQVHDYIVRRGYTDTKTSHAEARIKETIVQAVAELDSGIDPAKLRAAVAAGVDDALGNLEVSVARAGDSEG